MDMTVAFREVGTYRGAAAMCGCDPKTIKRALARLAAGDVSPARSEPQRNYDLVRGVVAHQREVDAAVARRLAQNWRLERIDATVRAILRAGVYELTHRKDVPTEVVIDEYVELTKSFFEGPEPGFVNGALDGVAKDVRS